MILNFIYFTNYYSVLFKKHPTKSSPQSLTSLNYAIFKNIAFLLRNYKFFLSFIETFAIVFASGIFV